MYFLLKSCKSSQKIIRSAEKGKIYLQLLFQGRYDTPISLFNMIFGFYFQESVISITAETLYKYHIDFNFSSQLATDFGSARSSHPTKPSRSQLRVGKFILFSNLKSDVFFISQVLWCNQFLCYFSFTERSSGSWPFTGGIFG